MAGPYTPAGPPSWGPPALWSRPAPQRPNIGEADTKGLSDVWTAALISMIGTLLGVAVFALSETGTFRVSVSTVGSGISISETGLYPALGVSIGGLAISVVSFYFYREGFRSFRTVDTTFATAPTWAVLVIIGLVLTGVGLPLFLLAAFQIASCSGAATTGVLSCANLGALLGGGLLLLVGGCVALVGYIGTLVAIWRLGGRFGDSLFKVAAVFLIIPFLSLVGQILILVATSNARSRLRNNPAYAMTPSTLYPPKPPYR